MSESLGEAYKKYLEGLLKNPKDKEQIKIYDYCAEGDFKTLWDRTFDSGTGTIIIVWDGRNTENSEPSELIPHLTPMDWALAFSIKQLKNDESPKPTIHIVDLMGKEHAEWSIRMRDQLLAEMPWVLLYAPLVPTDDGGQPLPFRRGYSEILGFDGEGKILGFSSGGETLLQFHKTQTSKTILPPYRTWANGSREHLKYLATQWSASLTQSDEHHDINNVIGVKLVVKDIEHKMLENAFRNRMKWSELEPGQERVKLTDVRKAILKNLGLSNLEIAVIDDHIDSGWKDFVDESIGKKSPLAENGGTVYAFTDDKVDTLIRFLEAVDWNKRDFSRKLIDYIFNRNTGDHQDKMEIILLDLRMPKLADNKQIKRLLDLAERVNQDSEATPQIFESKELDSIRRNPENNDEALLLLHRLLALALPLTPIVLFSVTGQARLREKLKPYRNILTNFEKPRPFSDLKSVERSATNLVDCVIKGLKMQRLRLKLAYVQAVQDRIEEARNNRELSADNDPRIEIYAAESGSYEDPDSNITSALAVCISPSNLADTLHEKLEDGATVDVGLGKHSTSNTGEPVFVVRKGSEINPDDVTSFKGVRTEPSYPHNHWCVVAAKSAPQEEIEGWSADMTDFPDAKLEEVLQFNLEFTLFALIPYLFEMFNGEIHLYFPARTVPLPPEIPPGALSSQFNLFEPPPPHTRGRSTHVQTWSEYSGFPFVRGWLSQWQSEVAMSIRKCIKQLLVFQLTEEESSTRKIWAHSFPSQWVPGPGPRLLHRIARWVAYASHDATEASATLKRELVEQDIFPRDNWFVENNSDTLTDSKHLMDALRIEYDRSDENDISANALRLILETSCLQDIQSLGAFNEQQKLILWKMKDKLGEAKGEVLHLLIDDAA